jgi:hypothetical protein
VAPLYPRVVGSLTTRGAILTCPQTGSQLQIQSQSRSHVMTDGQSVRVSWGRAPSDSYHQMFVAVLSLQGALSDERKGLSADGPLHSQGTDRTENTIPSRSVARTLENTVHLLFTDVLY